MIKSFFSAITVFLAVVRNITISKFKQKWIKLFFISLFIFIFILALFKADNWQECLPAVVSLIMTYAFIYTKKHILTFLIGLCSILWLIVGYAIGSYPIILLEILSILLLIYRAFRQKNKK